jgi:hypothetical protein
MLLVLGPVILLAGLAAVEGDYTWRIGECHPWSRNRMHSEQFEELPSCNWNLTVNQVCVMKTEEDRHEERREDRRRQKSKVLSETRTANASRQTEADKTCIFPKRKGPLPEASRKRESHKTTRAHCICTCIPVVYRQWYSDSDQKSSQPRTAKNQTAVALLGKTPFRLQSILPLQIRVKVLPSQGIEQATLGKSFQEFYRKGRWSYQLSHTYTIAEEEDT